MVVAMTAGRAAGQYSQLLSQYGASYNIARTGRYGNPDAACPPPLQNQAQCGGCYAFSTASVLGSSACTQGVSTATSSAIDMSPQFTLGVAFAQPEPNSQSCTSEEYCPHPNPCQGGWPLYLMYQTAEFCGAGNPCWMTCDDTCAEGCMPFTEANCTSPIRVIEPDSQVDSCHDCAGCNDFILPSSQTCSAPALDSNNALPLGVPLSVPVPPLSQSMQTVDDIVSSVRSVNVGDVQPNLLAGEATVERVMNWLQNYGPVSVAMDACDAFMDYWEGQYPAITTAGVSGCNGNLDHAVTVVGWATIDGVPCWTIQNSWGAELTFSNGYTCPSPDDGFFHVPFTQVGYGGNPNNLAIAMPTGVYFTTAFDSSSNTQSAAPSSDLTRRRHLRAAFRQHPTAFGPGFEQIVSDPTKQATLPGYAAALVSEQHGTAMSVSTVHNLTRSVARQAMYRAYVTLKAVDGSRPDETVVVHMARRNNHSYDYLQHEVITKARTNTAAESGSTGANTKLSSGATVGLTIGLAVAALILVVIAVFLFVGKRTSAQTNGVYSPMMTEAPEAPVADLGEDYAAAQ